MLTIANCQSIKVTVRYQSHCSECPSLKNLQTVNAGEDVGKRETSITAGAAVWQLLTKQKQTLGHRKQTYGYKKGNGSLG